MKKKTYLSINELIEIDILPGKNTEASIRALIARRQIPFRKLSGRIYFLRDEVEEWLRSREGNPLGKRRRPSPEIVSLSKTIASLDTMAISELKEAITELRWSIEFQNI